MTKNHWILRTLGVLSLLLSTEVAYAAIITTPGSVLGVYYPSSQLRSYDGSGVLTGTLSASAAGYAYTGLAVSGTDVYMSNNNSNTVFKIDTSTGAILSTFQVAGLAPGGGLGIEALGSHGSNLIASDYTTGEYREFTTSGAIVSSLTLAKGSIGIERVGNEIYSAQGTQSGTQPDSGNVRVYDATTGSLLRVVNTNLFGMSGLAYDALNDQFLINTGFGDQTTRRYSFNGTTAALLDSDGGNRLNGLAVFGSNTVVPEPTTLAIWSVLGGIGLVVGHRRRRRKLV